MLFLMVKHLLELTLVGVPQGSMVSFLFLLIYTNDLSENLKSTVKSFADDVPIFNGAKDPQYIAEILNHDLFEWAYRWKMSFKPEPSKQAQEVVNYSKATKADDPSVLYLMVT